MKLWLLKARDEELPDDDNPWNPSYDKTFGLVIRAPSETEARQQAQSITRNEEDDYATATSPWLDSKYSTCIELVNDGEAAVLMTDFRRA